MSRLIKKTINIPEGITVMIENESLLFKGPKGELILNKLPLIDVLIKDKEIQVLKKEDSKQAKMNSGTMWSLIKNAISGVNFGFEKILEIEGIGYRAEVNNKNLVLYLGFSHPINVSVPEDISVKVEKNQIIISGINKEKVGQFASKIRLLKPPEPYKGKGIHYKGEYIRRKAGKKAGA
ncbi:MAG: 50S ribosomal protein L6 [Patescibacteria group bacterium]|nr:50S ribosomal protein L6 [Patescibacteria group bacterium]MCX7589888.1 50S ribosomal protein L6 [Patescibacteria group bacterium]MDW8279569.1 50S ribosomal protein L6 [bacterium]